MTRRVRTLTTVVVMLLAGLSLGLLGSPRAGASCPGPQLTLERAGQTVSPTSRSDGGSTSRLEVRAGERLGYTGIRLTNDCFDTNAGTAGCQGPTPQPIQTPAPIPGATLVLLQNGRPTTLIEHVTIDQQLTASGEFVLPTDLRAGPATLVLAGPDQTRGARLDLQIT